MKTKKFGALKIILSIWLAVATVYVAYNEYVRLNLTVRQAYNAGISNAVNQLINEAQKCEPVPVTANGRGVNLINVECLQENPPAPAENVQ